MIRFLMALCLMALPAFAAEEGLRVTLLFGAGQTPLDFRLSPQETRQFWLRWKELQETHEMVPVASSGGGYRGLRLRVDSDEEIRLFDGIGSLNGDARVDQYRVLERWVLSKAPAPLGPQLVAALDKKVSAAATERAAPLDERNARKLIAVCRKRADNNMRLRAMCLSEKLLEAREPDVAVKALENALRGTEAAPKD